MKLGPRVQRSGVQGCRVWWFIALCVRERYDEPSSQQAPSIIIAIAITIIIVIIVILIVVVMLIRIFGCYD